MKKIAESWMFSVEDILINCISPYYQHIVPNVYLGVELKTLDNPTGTSYNGESTTGKRRCCDIPRTDNCAAADDLCDLQVSVCIGE